MRDRVSVNGKAMRTNGIMYPGVMDTGCFSHTLDLVGANFKTPTLAKFMKHWVKLFQHSGRYAVRGLDSDPSTSCQPGGGVSGSVRSSRYCFSEEMFSGFLQSIEVVPKSCENIYFTQCILYN